MLPPKLDYQNIIKISQDAGQIIYNVRRNPEQLRIDYKQDRSPVTLADQLAHNYIYQTLSKLYPEIPIISEENDHDTHIDNIFFLVDPLDGTRDFINGTNDYSVNIALIYNHRPILGVIYLPETNECYYALAQKGCFHISDCQDFTSQLKLMIAHQTKDKTQIISPRSSDKGFYYFDKSLEIHKTLRAGSAKKFCMIAKGIADIYPRPGQTGEWDTAAGDLIVTEAGGIVYDKNNQPLIYGKKYFMNDAFYASNFMLNSLKLNS